MYCPLYCPLCGSPLELIEQPDLPEIDWDLPAEELDRKIAQNEAMEECEREEYSCVSGCFGKDFPLYCHHPFGGINSAPGDSWSLSWVK